MLGDASDTLDVVCPKGGNTFPLRYSLRRDWLADFRQPTRKLNRPATLSLHSFQNVHESDESITFRGMQAEKSMNESGRGDMLPPMPNIGNRIKRLREFVPGRTQAEFARFLGVSRGAVGNWELGKGIKRENLNIVAQRVGVWIDWLMNGPDDGPIPFLPAAGVQVMSDIAADETLTVAEATKALAAAFLELEAAAEAEAQVLARAVLRALRTRSTQTGQLLSEPERLALIATAIRLFRSKQP